MPLLSPYDAAIQARLTPTMPAMSSGAPEDFVTRARMMRQQAIAAAPQGIDPRIAAILARREERLAGQEEEIAQQEARSPWDALARAGAAMAASQSPFFGQGVAAGVNEGLNSLNQGRAEAVRRRMALGGARDDIEMERIEQERAGRKQASADLETDLKLGTSMAELSKARAAAEVDLARANEINDPVMRRLKIGEAQRRLAKIDSEIALDSARIGTERAQAFKYTSEGRAAGAGGRKGGTGFLSPAEVAEAGLDPRTVWQRNNAGTVSAVGKAKAGNPAEVARLLEEANGILPGATGSGGGAAIDAVANFFGRSTPGSDATARLEVIAGALIANMPRMEGSQSNADLILYKQAAGDLANPNLPVSRRQAARDTLVSLNNKYINQDDSAVSDAFAGASSVPNKFSPSDFKVTARKKQ